tara:strand:+ start:599 stop:886 length:288 start_codon:yes stop_codon:yes gene_type:complete
METLLKADIFFFVTTIVVIVLSIVIAVALVYVVRILRDILHVTRNVRDESDKIVADVDEFRSDMKKQGTVVSSTISILLKGVNSTLKRIIHKKKK